MYVHLDCNDGVAVNGGAITETCSDIRIGYNLVLGGGGGGG